MTRSLGTVQFWEECGRARYDASYSWLTYLAMHDEQRRLRVIRDLIRERD